ncbi:iron-containing alcohol dehydrogenase [Thalassobaculum sp.]|uniref:iron-containing alcohol dehydrogenase n=1 Tax=Thalassobaculum sp. TaxID=2022740 RepID=UPI0032EC55F4
MTRQGRVAFGRMEAVSFGRPAAEAVAEELAALGADRVFLMVSGTLNRETDEIAKLRRALGDRCVGTYDRMRPHTPRGDVIAAAWAVREAGADTIVTLGGGSVTDAAKAVRLCLANGIDTPEGMDAFRPVKGADGTLAAPAGKAPAVRQVAVPTTLSAGDFSGLAGVTDERTHTKEIFRHSGMIPSAVVLDPAVTVHTPEWLWTSTGIRALDHCVEGVCAKEAHPYGDAQALQALSLLARGLPAVQRNPADLAARLDCQMGMWLSMGPLASGVPMGASHGIGYVLGAMYDVPHGHTSCIMLPAVMRWNRQVNADRQALVAAAMGRPGEDAGDVLDAFIGGLGMPRSLSAVGIGPDKFQRIAEGAMGTPWVPRNPRPIPSPAEVLEILKLAA